MPGYIKKILQRFHHKMPPKPQHSPYQVAPKIYGAAAQDTIPEDDMAKIDKKRVKVVQQVIGGVLYYSRAVDLTVLPALSSIASKQASATKNTKKKVE